MDKLMFKDTNEWIKAVRNSSMNSERQRKLIKEIKESVNIVWVKPELIHVGTAKTIGNDISCIGCRKGSRNYGY
jgi:hypothetical protein